MQKKRRGLEFWDSKARDREEVETEKRKIEEGFGLNLAMP